MSEGGIANIQTQTTSQELATNFSIKVDAKTIPSDTHPDRNEDAMFQFPRTFGIFDGMGGHANGQEAARLARAHVAESLNKPLSLEEMQVQIRQSLIEANKVVTDKAKEQGNDMGSTAVVGHIWEGPNGEKKAIFGTVGDSRAYIFRLGVLSQVSIDDNLVKLTSPTEESARVMQRKLNNVTTPADLAKLTPQEQSLYMQRNGIAQSLGSNKVNPNIYTLDLRPGDKIFLASDGVTDNLTEKEIADILAKSSDPQSLVQNLTKAAQERSRDTSHPRAKPDDMSALVATIPDAESSVTPAAVQEQQPVKPADDILRKGAEVKVKRSDGTIDTGWTLDGFNSKTGEAIVSKIGTDGKTLQKEIPPNELRQLNQEIPKVGIESATDFISLFKEIDAGGPIQGSQETYNPQVLKELINKVRSGKTEIDAVPRTNGLRQKVGDLLQMEQVRKSIK